MYTCKYCGKAFIKSGHLGKHQQTCKQVALPVVYNFGNSWTPVQAMDNIMAMERVDRPHYEVLLALYECITHYPTNGVYVRCKDTEYPPYPKECQACGFVKCNFKFIGYVYAHEWCALCEVAAVIHYTMSKEQYDKTPKTNHNLLEKAIAKNSCNVLDNFTEVSSCQHQTLVKSARKT